MSNEKNDDAFSGERAQRKYNRQMSDLNAARRVPMNAPHSSLTKLANDRGAKVDFVAFDEYKHIEPPRHPATDLVTALKLLKEVATPAARKVLDRYDWQAWSENVADLLKQFPNLK